MLVLAGVELIFFTVASVGLCSGFVLEQRWEQGGVLVTAEQRLPRAKGFSAPQPTPPASGLGGTRGWEGTQWDSWPPLTQGISHTTGCHVQLVKLEEEGGRGACLG